MLHCFNWRCVALKATEAKPRYVYTEKHARICAGETSIWPWM